MAKKKFDTMPSYDELIIPTLKALKQLGGSGTIDEINENVYRIAKLPDETLKITHGDSSLQSEIDYRLAWSRTYLKKFGLIENSSRGVWVLSKPDVEPDKINYNEIVKTVKESMKANNTNKPSDFSEMAVQVESIVHWKEELLETLLTIAPDAFERLAQRILRESGFVQVEVTGKSGDGGIDGKGIVKISGFLSFHVIFQCKRYRKSVTPSEVRDFRGAMQGRADKGLLITTGTFTRDAIKEATRDGAPPIDLIDGELLCEKLKEFKLGVSTEFVEQVQINTDWFSQL
ncbi:MAG: restriction endonuclease [Cytophagales bacterium]|jgi:restriction system protein|nr:restriction endonuclease [Cytophagales bacterium]